MRKIMMAIGLLTALCGTAQAQSAADPRAAAVVDQMMQAMGGPTQWEHTRFLRFDWVVERDGKTVAYVRHLWDRYDGRYRVEWESRDAKKIAALFNVNTRAGRVFVDGAPVPEAELPKYLEQAYGRFINDSYWLLMPWKLKDPGVRLEYAGETELDGQTYDLVHVSFGKVGLTPGDNYWAFVSRQGHLMERWAYFLESYAKDKGSPALEKATPWQWVGWEEVNGLRLARERRGVGTNARIYFPVLLAPHAVEARAFESLEVPMPGAARASE